LIEDRIQQPFQFRAATIAKALFRHHAEEFIGLAQRAELATSVFKAV
jgi:hypothetical protein